MVGEDKPHKQDNQRAGGGIDKRAGGESELQSKRPPEKSEGGASRSRKGKVIPRYHDRVEDYAYVTEADLKEAVDLSIVQQVMIQVGTFFFSGAFWLLAELIIREGKTDQFQFTPWMAVCILSVMFGAVLWLAGWFLFRMKQKKLTKYFPAATS
jgi:hypothetical protein